MTRNVFETLTGAAASSQGTATLSHADQEAIFRSASVRDRSRRPCSRRAATYGIENVELLFPDASPSRVAQDLLLVGLTGLMTS